MNPQREQGSAQHPGAVGLDDSDPTAPDHIIQDEPGLADDDRRSLMDDIEDLIFDAKTYLDAELIYQKTRASFVAACVKRIVAFGVVAAVVALVAFIALAIGLIIAFTPLITAWGATALVVGALLLGVYLLIRMAGSAWGEMMDAVHEEDPGDGESHS